MKKLKEPVAKLRCKGRYLKTFSDKSMRNCQLGWGAPGVWQIREYVDASNITRLKFEIKEISMKNKQSLIHSV